MGKFTTQNRKEAKNNPDLIYISKESIRGLAPIKVIRCKNCRGVIGEGVENKYSRNGACSQWCLDFINPPKVNHQCIYCDNACTPIRTKKEYEVNKGKKNGYTKTIGTITNWHKVCEDCKTKRHEQALENVEKRKNAKKKVIDTVGHFCTHCNIYKTWDNFIKNKKGGYYYPCKDCKKILHKNWSEKNKDKVNKNSNIYYHTKRKLINKARNGK